MDRDVVIVGGGLAGLTAAFELQRAGIDFLLIEARMRLGGRILSADVSGALSADGFDLGPSWFWPGMQPTMESLVDELGLRSFPQNSEGDVVFQRMSREQPQRLRGMRQEPESMRIIGGTGAMVASLASKLPAGSIRLGVSVKSIAQCRGAIEIGALDGDGREQIVRARQVLLAAPPRLLEASIAFDPPLDFKTAQLWRDTATWMAPHAKFFAVYDRPFWRDAGLSGTAQSMVGPLAEIHDATTASGKAALFGFVGIPAEHRKKLGRDAIVMAAIGQLVTLFGPEAGAPIGTLFKDWAEDPLTATSADQVAGGHPIPGSLDWAGPRWREQMFLGGSETSVREPGYLAGAIEAARRAVMHMQHARAEPRSQETAP
ncbi:MAG: FAD-dependent oxidoreductase [Pseudomonadota bacterium]|nr:FAD-dependent oxidoreductase [Pseudomonadota bacterium]